MRARTTITGLARRHGLSRSTLLYYDRIGLLRPTGRTAAGYRQYTPGDDRRLERICRYRAAGLSLEAIAELLQGGEGAVAAALVARLEALNGEVRRLQAQQRFLLELLGPGSPRGPLPFLDRDRFVAMLEAGGFTDEDMDRWHAAFERTDPAGHQAFLEFLGLPGDAVAAIRAAAGAGAPGGAAGAPRPTGTPGPRGARTPGT